MKEKSLEAEALDRYLSRLVRYKSELFDLYEGAHLQRKRVSRGGGWTWGYVLVGDEGKASGSSIGEDELKFFLDLCLLTEPESAYVIGHAFGLSTFALALAGGPDCRVFAIDNWNEGADPQSAKQLSESLLRSRRQLANVRLHTGSSPADTPRALKDLDRSLSLIFIDAEHSDLAAYEDFAGCLPFIDDSTICVWHNVDSTVGAFDRAWKVSSQQFFDQRYVLHTYGPMGIFFRRSRHPGLESYLRHSMLIWHDWEDFLPVIRRAGRCRALLERDRRLPARIERCLRRAVARVLRPGGGPAAVRRASE